MDDTTALSPSQESFLYFSGSGCQDHRSDPPLVLPSISQTRPLDRGFSGLVFYKRSLKVLRHIPQPRPQKSSDFKIKFLYGDEYPEVEQPKRGTIDSFSYKSKGRLQHIALNADCDFKSQMTLTYDLHDAPDDGEELKSHLNKYLVALRRKFPGFKYLWVLEFQRNGNPHFHLFSNLEYSTDMAVYLGSLWNRYVKGSDNHYKVHTYVPNHRYKRPVRPGERHGAFSPWQMGDGSYLCYKYLSKDNQKRVPPHFRNVGRFWGATRGIVKPDKTLSSEAFYTLFQDTVNTLTGELITAQQHINRFFRDLRAYQEKRINRARWSAYNSEVKKSRGRYPVNKPKKFTSPIRRPVDAMINKGRQFYEQWFQTYQAGFEIPF